MKRACIFVVLLMAGGIALLVGAQAQSNNPAVGSNNHRQLGNFSDWSEPVNIGPVINSEYNERFPTISNNGLSLYFASDRPGGFGSYDMYVSHRAIVDSPWEEPQNLGPTINSSSSDHSQNFSRDGHWMYFVSDRPGGCGDLDMWVSYREDTEDDFAWEIPENLGCAINTEFGEACPFYFEDQETGINTLYFVSNRPGGPGNYDIYASVQQEDGSFGAPIVLREVSSPQADFHFGVRSDGLEAFIWTARSGGLGLQDIWVSTRADTQEAWSTPVNLGPTINTEFNEQMPSLSLDGTTLFFPSDRPGGHGGFDLYVSTRKKFPDDVLPKSEN